MLETFSSSLNDMPSQGLSLSKGLSYSSLSIPFVNTTQALFPTPS